MSNKFVKRFLSASIAAGLVIEAAPAIAQLEEVIVFARKREETILQVPVTATALSGNTLDQYAVGDIKAIADKVAGLTFSTSNNSSGTRVFLRGVGTTTNNAAVDSSVALVSDGQQFTQGLAFRAALYDMAQVEVLKGPQALFYGKAAPGGVISIRTADPGDQFEAILRTGYEFEAEEKVGEFVLSGPVTDTLGLRLAGKYSDAEGYYKNEAMPPVGAAAFGAEAPDDDGFPTENLILRGTALWNPTDTFNARFKATYVKDEIQGTGTSSEQVYCPEGPDPSIPLPFGYAPLTGNDCKLSKNVYKPGLDPAAFGDGRPRRNGGDPFNEAEQYFTSLELNWDLKNHLTLTSLTGYYEVDQENIGEISASTNVGNLVYVDGTWDREDITQEFRLTSDYDGRLNFMVGGFYHDGESIYNIDIPLLVTFQPLFGGWQNFGWAEQTMDVEALSFFGQVLWDITPQLELGVGTRWTDEERELTPIEITAFTTYNPSGALIPIATPKIDSDNWSPEVTLTYRPTDDLTVFASLKRAYKSGSFDTGGTPSPGEEVSFGDEKVQAGEIGIKTRMMDGRLTFNATAYYQEFEDLQVQAQSQLDTGSVAVRTLNAAEAEIYGIDMDIAFTPEGLEGLTLFGAVNWNEAEYTDFPNAPCYYGQLSTEGCDQLFSETALELRSGGFVPAFTAQDLKGESLVQAPEWSLNFGFDYVTPVFDNMTLGVGTFTTYSSKYSTMIENWYYQDDFWKLGASVGLSGADEKWSVELIGNNLTDELISGQCNAPSAAETFVFGSVPPLAATGTPTPGLAGHGEVTCSLEPGRSVFLRLTLRL